MPNPKVSVCIPTYNYGRFIGEAIRSVLNQTFEDFELIIVDNCSTDNTKEIVKGFKDVRIKYFRNKLNLGMVGNWNKCLDLSCGKYILILHADDRILPGMLETNLSVLEKNENVGLAYSGYDIIDKYDSVVRTETPFLKNHIWDGIDELKTCLVTNYIRAPTVIVPKKCYACVGKFDKKHIYAADWEMWMRIMKNGYRIAYTATNLAQYRIHDTNETKTNLKLQDVDSDEYAIIRKVMLDLPISKINDLKTKVLASHLSRSLYCAFGSFLKMNFGLTSYYLKRWLQFGRRCKKDFGISVYIPSLIYSSKRLYHGFGRNIENDVV